MAGKKKSLKGATKGGEFAPGGGRVAGQGKKETSKDAAAGEQARQDRVARAKKAHVLIGKEEQNYAKANEPKLAHIAVPF